MPQYKITDNTTGKSLKITGTTQPTQEDVSGIFNDYYKRSGRDDVIPEAPRSAKGFGRNIVSSGKQLGKDIFSAVAHPVQTAKSLGELAVGTGQLLIPGEQGLEDRPRAVGEFYKQRYSPENIGTTVYEDPLGVASDVATVAGLGAGVFKGAAKVGSLAGLSDEAVRAASSVGKGLRTAERFTDPLQATGAIAGKVMKLPQRAPSPQRYTENIELAAKHGVDLPVSAKYKSPIIQQAEAMTIKGPFGSKTAEGVQKAFSRVDELRSGVRQAEVPSYLDASNAGEVIKKGLSRVTEKFKGEAGEMYDAIPDLDKVTVDAIETKAFLDDIVSAKLRSKVPSPELGFYESSLEKMKGALTAEDVRETLKSVGSRIKDTTDVISKADRGSLKRFYQSLSMDLDSTLSVSNPDALQKIKSASSFYKEGIEKINSKLGKNIQNKTPEQILDAIVKPNSETTIRLLKDLLDEGEVKALSESFVEKILYSSLDPAGEFINPIKLGKQVDKYGRGTVLELIGEDGLSRIDDIITETQELGKLRSSLSRSQKVAEGSQTGFLNKFTGAGMAGILSPQLMLPYLMGEYGMSKIIERGASPAGFSRAGTGASKLPSIPSLSKVKKPLQEAYRAGRFFTKATKGTPEEETTIKNLSIFRR